jgi:hypothetical protein
MRDKLYSEIEKAKKDKKLAIELYSYSIDALNEVADEFNLRCFREGSTLFVYCYPHNYSKPILTVKLIPFVGVQINSFGQYHRVYIGNPNNRYAKTHLENLLVGSLMEYYRYKEF